MINLSENVKPYIDEHYIRPAKAEDILKNAHNSRQTLYVCGPTGFGKTSLVADALARRRYLYLQAGLTDEMLQGVDQILETASDGKECIVVIDDLHIIDSEETREELLPKLQKLMARRDVWLILISRAAIPSWLRTLYIQYVFVVIDERTLYLTENEAKKYFDSWEISYSDEDVKRVMEVMFGYPLPMKIFAMRMLSYGKNAGLGSQLVEDAIQKGYTDLYDYYGVHVIDEWDIEMQEFLMELSIIEKFDIKVAQAITRRGDVESMLLKTKERGSFLSSSVEGEKVMYEFRDVMRAAFLRRLMIKTSKTYRDQLYYSAGAYYETIGDVVNALEMYEKGNNDEGISRLLISNTRNHTGNGHYWQLRRYYRNLPEEIIKKSPELMAGMSMLESISMNDEESERWYAELEKYVKEHSGSEKKHAQARLGYLDISLPHKGITNIISSYKNLSAIFMDRKNISIEFSTSNNQPTNMYGGKDFCEWSKKDTYLAKTIGKMVEFVLGKNGKGLVNLALAESYFEKGRDFYEVTILADRGRLQAESIGNFEQMFVGVGIVSQISVLNNHFEDAVAMLDALRKIALVEAPQIITGIDSLKTRFYLYTGQILEVNEWFKQAPNEDEEFCTLDRYHYMTKIRVYISMGKKEKALSLLNRMVAFSELRERTFFWIECKILIAIILQRMNNKTWIENMQEAISKAEEYHFVRIFSREGAAVSELIEDERLVWSDESFKKQVIEECGVQAKFYPNYLREKSGDIKLSDMALNILRMQAEGMKNEAIAEKLDMSVANVKYHNTETYKKLGVKSKAAAVIEARKRHLI